MRKKIIHITTVHDPFDARIFYKECKTLAKAGYEVYLIAQHDKEEIIEGIHIIPLPMIKERWKRIFLLIRILKMTLSIKADIYHFHDPELILLGLILKLFGKKVIYDVHEDVPEQIMSKSYIPSLLRYIVSLAFNFTEKTFSMFFDYIITTTDSIKKKFLKYNKKVLDVKNYMLLSYLKSRDDRSLNLGKFVIIFIGGIYNERGILECTIACNMLGKRFIRFFLFGDIDLDYYSKIKEVDILNLVEYKGKLPYEKVLEEVLNADAGFVCDYPLKRHKEGLPVKLFEYMSAGIPVIASNFPLWKEIVEDNNCGICVNPLDPKEIADAIKYILEHPNEAKIMGENGRKAVLEKYNWEKESEKLINVYRELLSRK